MLQFVLQCFQANDNSAGCCGRVGYVQQVADVLVWGEFHLIDYLLKYAEQWCGSPYKIQLLLTIAEGQTQNLLTRPIHHQNCGEPVLTSRGTPALKSLCMQISILVMVGGAVLAGATDLTYSLPGYIWVTICAVSTAAYLLLIRKLSDRTGISLIPPHPYVQQTIDHKNRDYYLCRVIASYT